MLQYDIAACSVGFAFLHRLFIHSFIRQVSPAGLLLDQPSYIACFVTIVILPRRSFRLQSGLVVIHGGCSDPAGSSSSVPTG